jgi:hypothetical protein
VAAEEEEAAADFSAGSADSVLCLIVRDCNVARPGQHDLFLASVRDEAEAATLPRPRLHRLKEPRRARLARSTGNHAQRVAPGYRVAVSATIGDLPMQPETVGVAVLEKAACGADYVKFGLRPRR